MSGPWHTVHVRVNEAATGQPTPVRLRLTNAAGGYFAPFGRLKEFATGRNQDVGGNLLLGMKPFAYIDGSCEVRLPAGPIRVEIHKGPEYLPVRLETILAPGQLALRFQVERWSDLRRDGWYAGDTRVHFLTPQGALLEAEAEDLAVVNLLAAEETIPGSYGKTFSTIPNILAFSGQRPALEKAGCLVAVNTHNTHPVLGSLGLLHCHRTVYPLSFGGPDRLDDWTLADWCDQCHRKNGVVVWTKPFQGHPDFGGEALADLVLGKVDALEIDFFEDSPFDILPDWYGLLNCGLRVPLAGASGKDNNGVALGSMRTYAHLPPGEELTYTRWIEAVCAGRTFVSNGPLLSLTAAGQEPGAVIDLPGPTETLRVRAEARSGTPFDHLEVIFNGQVVAAAEAGGSPSSAIVEADLAVSASGWLAARCRGQAQVWHRPANQRIFAHTSPVYVQLAGQPMRPAAATLTRWLGQLDRMREWVAHEGRFENDRQRDYLGGIFESARNLLEQRGR